MFGQPALLKNYGGIQDSFRFRVNETMNRRISNVEYRMSKEGILSILMVLIGRAKRFHPSKFDIQNSAVLRFAFALIPEPIFLNLLAFEPAGAIQRVHHITHVLLIGESVGGFGGKCHDGFEVNSKVVKKGDA